MDHNGGSVVAMVGKDCVAIASDLRLGAGAMTVAMNFEKVSSSLLSLSDFSEVHTYLRRSFLSQTGYTWDSRVWLRTSQLCAWICYYFLWSMIIHDLNT